MFVEWLDIANKPDIASMELLWHPRASLNWWFSWAFGAAGFQVMIPLWFPALLSLFATALAWRADAKHTCRARLGHCTECGYDRAGLAPVAPCPECGNAPKSR